MKTTLNFSLLHENHQACYLFLSGKLYMIFLPDMWPILFFKSQRWRYYTLEANLDIITTQKSHCFCQAKTILKRMQWWCSVSCKTKLLFSKTDMLHASKCDITILQHPPGRGFWSWEKDALAIFKIQFCQIREISMEYCRHTIDVRSR